jgi:hypothetical protein
MKKLVLEAAATFFQNSDRGVGSQWGHLGENIVLGGPDWRQTGAYSHPPGGQKTNSGSNQTGHCQPKAIFALPVNPKASCVVIGNEGRARLGGFLWAVQK